MPSSRKNRRQRIDYTVNKKQEWRKWKKKINPSIECKQIRDAWDKSKSVKDNLKEMGIAYDPNDKKVIRKITSIKPKMIEDPRPNGKLKAEKGDVVMDLEAEAALGEKDKTFKLSNEEVMFCTYMLDKYHECYKGMARDRRNHYQLTPKQIRAKIRAFKRAKTQYQAYLDSKNPKKSENNDVEME